MSVAVALSSISRCFQGVIPSTLATVDSHGIPNVTLVSQVRYVDEQHVAISRQFFNKTSRNLDETGRAFVETLDPLTLQAYRLRLRFLRSETEGPLFESMALRIEAIASHTGMAGIFRLTAADVFEVESAERVDGFLDEEPVQADMVDARFCGDRSEIRALQVISDGINRAGDRDSLSRWILESLDDELGLEHTMLLLRRGDLLVTVASRGYPQSGIGAEIRIGDGMIGTAARERQVLRMTGLGEDLRYGRAARTEVQRSGGQTSEEIPLPGLPDTQCALIIPLWTRDRLIGALAAESQDPMAFGDWHEAYLELLANQIAMGIAGTGEESPGTASAGAATAHRRLTFTWYPEAESIFVDGEYLTRSVPAKILWKLLSEWKANARSEFTNRELRMDGDLGLPAVKDNLESRLILLRRRLENHCPEIRIDSSGRGRFLLVVDAEIVLERAG